MTEPRGFSVWTQQRVNAGRELNMLVAVRVMGAKTHKKKPKCSDMLDGTVFIYEDECWTVFGGEMAPWDPTTVLHNAFEVADKVTETTGFRFSLLYGGKMQPFAEFLDVATGTVRYQDSDDSREFAICVAALAAIGVSEAEIHKAYTTT